MNRTWWRRAFVPASMTRRQAATVWGAVLILVVLSVAPYPGVALEGVLVGMTGLPVDLFLRGWFFARRTQPRFAQRRFNQACNAVTIAILVGAFAVAAARHQSTDQALVAEAAALCVATIIGNWLNRLLFFVVFPSQRGRGRLPSTAAHFAAHRRDDPGRVDLLMPEARAHLREDHPAFAVPLFREAADCEVLSKADRLRAVETLGWTLLYLYPDDPVPAESRTCLARAEEWGGSGFGTLKLKAFLAVNDGRWEEGLRLAQRAQLLTEGVDAAQMLCVQAVAERGRGNEATGAALQSEATALWPECDLLPWVDEMAAGPR